MNRNILFKDGRFELPLLWKDVSVELLESLSMARRRLEEVKHRLFRGDALKKMYCQQIESVLKHGYAEQVPKDEWESSNRVWYTSIPHYPVMNPNKPGKVRIVYDRAAPISFGGGHIYSLAGRDGILWFGFWFLPTNSGVKAKKKVFGAKS